MVPSERIELPFMVCNTIALPLDEPGFRRAELAFTALGALSRLRQYSLSLVAGMGFEPMSSAYETDVKPNFTNPA
jgi:hypothetical protein